MNYPRQCCKVKRANQVLSVEAFLAIAGENDLKSNPLEIPGYSLFKLTIIDKKGNKTITPFANIPEADVSMIKTVTDIAIEEAVKNKVDASEALTAGATSSVRFRTGQYIGKTPMEILMENPEQNKGKLLAQKDFLAKNVEKFPNNQPVMDAIDEAITLHESGSNVNVEPQKSTHIIIYEQKVKILERIKKKGDDSRCRIYNITMAYDSTKKNPFTIRIANGFAKINKTAIGAMQADMRSVVDKEESTMSLTESEFVSMVNRMNELHEAFVIVNLGPQYKKTLCGECIQKRKTKTGNATSDYCVMVNGFISRDRLCEKEEAESA